MNLQLHLRSRVETPSASGQWNEVTRLQELSRANKIRFHLPDGPAQQARDAEWSRASDRAPDALRWLYAHDPAALEPMPA